MTTSENSRPGAGLPIGDVARLCGISTRAVRHYHDVGLLPEPSRDSCGYRRYAAANVIALVRITRLRALGMPVPQIAVRVRSGGSADDELHKLADELGDEIARLTDLQSRVVAAIGAKTPSDPAEALAAALREYGRLGEDVDLAPADIEAAGLLDALHPGGVAGVIDAVLPYLRDPGAAEVFSALVERYQGLTDTSEQKEIEALAAEFAPALPRPEHAPPAVDLNVMDRLLGDRLNNGQRRFMHELRRIRAGSDA